MVKHAIMPVLLFLSVCCGKIPPRQNIVLNIMDSTKVVSDLSPFIVETVAIPLTGSPRLLSPSARKILVHPSGFVVLAGGEVFCFDANGMYCFQFGRRGRGPGEYLHVSDICISSDNKELICLTSLNEVIFYSLSDGTFMKKTATEIRGITADAVFPADGNNSFSLYFPNPPLPDISNFSKDFYQVRRFNARGRQISEEINRRDFAVSMSFLSPSKQSAGNKYILSFSFSSGLCFEVDAQEIRPFRYLDLGGDAISPRFACKGKGNPWDQMGAVFNGEENKCPTGICATADLCFATVFSAHNSVWSIVTKGDRGIRWLSVPFRAQFLWPLAADENYFYYYYTGSAATEEQDPLRAYLVSHGFVDIETENAQIIKIRFSL